MQKSRIAFNSRYLENLVRDYRFPETIYVTQPTMPDLKDYHGLLEQIWERKWLTNSGKLHEEFERRLAEYLGVKHVCLFCNGTIALLVALHALRINSGEVITTPFTFPATPHVLYWNGIKPVFCDIDPITFNLNPHQVEDLITPETKAILPTHVFGTSCDIDAIREIGNRHGLYVIYDAAHSFGVKYKERSVVEFGDMSMLSFHATKLFSTGEGGALVVKSDEQRKRVNFLKNFGIAGEEEVIGPGINGKMNEFQAAFGLLMLDMVEDEIANRRELVRIYQNYLKNLPGITYLNEISTVEQNYSYFPVLVDRDQYGMNRNELYSCLRLFNVHPRKYFYPLCSHYSCYSALPSARPENLPVAELVADQVLCLPVYGTLDENAVKTICAILRELHYLAKTA